MITLPVRAHHEQNHPYWGDSQTRTLTTSWMDWNEWLRVWHKPYPEKAITGLRIEPAGLPASSPAISTR